MRSSSAPSSWIAPGQECDFIFPPVCGRLAAYRRQASDLGAAPVRGAAWIRSPEGTNDGRRRRGKELLATLTRIQKVVYLQTVDLFTYCNAEQMMRIAGIVRQESFDQGERIYSVNDSAEAMYCVVEGAVGLRPENGSERGVARRETFGASEILSDRLRGEDAWAKRPTMALVIDAEDLFDLLSNNVEIVKALFRQLLRHPETFEHLHESATIQLATN